MATAELQKEAAAAQARGDVAEARRLCEALLARDDAPHFDVRASLYNMARAAGNYRDAEDHARAMLALRPDFGGCVVGLAQALTGQGRVDEALETYRTALRDDMDQPGLWVYFAALLDATGRLKDATQAIERAVALDPEHLEGVQLALHLKLKAASWDGLPPVLAMVRRLLAKGAPLNPYALMFFLQEAEDLRRTATAYGALTARRVAGLPAWQAPEGKREGPIRVGFFSNTLRSHATGFLARQMLEHHNRDDFTFLAFPYATEPRDAFTDDLLSLFADVEDLSRATDAEAVQRLRAANLDILIDVDGYANKGRPGPAAARVAPVQAAWLGCNVTSGSPQMDYFIADDQTVPATDGAAFSEAIIRLPGTFFPHDGAREPSKTFSTRASAGLPQKGLVLSVFHQPAKIRPSMLDCWVRIVKAIPDAVLWFWDHNPVATDNLRHELTKRGVDEARAIFAPSVTPEDHLARLAHADLFLDSFPCNAHTTMLDALAARVPAVTIRGETLVSRIAASMLVRAGLESCVMDSLEAYEARVLELAQDKKARSALKTARTKAVKRTGLLDGVRFARNFEAALRVMAQRGRDGLEPESFSVPDQVA